MGHARGVLCLASAQAGVAVHTLAHAHVKRALVGSGSARKAQVNAMVTRLLRLAQPPKPYDVSDALALALAYLNLAGARPVTRFARISGSLVERSGETAIVEAAGLGYEIVLPPCIAEKIPTNPGDRVVLEIYAVLNLDGNSGRFTCFGFTNAIEREFFEALLTVRVDRAALGERAFVPGDVNNRTCRSTGATTELLRRPAGNRSAEGSRRRRLNCKARSPSSY